MNILDALRIRGIEYRPYGDKPNEYVICCLFCPEKVGEEDLKYRLGFNTRTGDAHCFKCDWGFRKIGIKVLAEGINMLEQVDELGEDLVQEKEIPVPTNIELPDDFEMLMPKPEDEWGLQAYDYLRSRGVKKWQIKKHQIGYCLSGQYAFRIVFPVYWGKKLKGLVGRAFANQELRYLNTPGMKCIYGIPKTKENTIAVLVEGVIDRLAIERALGPYNHSDIGALLGHSLTEFQIKQLRGYEQLIIWPDGDAPGIKGSIKVAEELKSDFELFMVTPYMEYDPGELSDATLLRGIGNAKRYSDSVKMRLQAMVAFEE